MDDIYTRYLASVRNPYPVTVNRKQRMVARLKADFPIPPNGRISHAKPSDVDTWLAGYNFNYASYNLHLECVQAVFRMAVADKVIISSPAAEAKRKKIVRPRRITPTYEGFNSIVADVRKQVSHSESEDSGDYLEFRGEYWRRTSGSQRYRETARQPCEGATYVFQSEDREALLRAYFPASEGFGCKAL